MYAVELFERAIATVYESLGTPAGIWALASAGLAAALNVAGTFVKTMIPLRWLAVGANLGFISYGALFPSLPMLLLHGAMLPVNIYRAAEMVRLTRRVNAAAASRDSSGVWLRPYMKRRKLAAGTVLFRKGDSADYLYMLASGRIELVEIGAVLEPGRIFGEISFFAPDRRRTLTARCLEPCQLLSINESTVRQLYFQNPEFGFQMIGLVAGRLSADIHRLETALAAGGDGAAALVGSGTHNASMTGDATPVGPASGGSANAAPA